MLLVLCNLASATDTPAEIVGLREQYAKHFDNQDGTNTAVAYAFAVHKQQNGEWREIDNTLQSVENAYRNIDGLFDVSFAKQNGENSISQDGFSITWRLENSQPRTAQIVDMTDPNDPYAATKAIGGITYSEVFPGVDLTYTINPVKVKEDIVLKTPTQINAFSTLITAQGLTPQLRPDGEVVFSDEVGNARFVFPAPFMSDANFETSRDIAVTLTQVGEQWRYTLTPSAEWLATAAFPVTLDPTITGTPSTVKDSYTYNGCVSGFANSKCNAATMDVGNKASASMSKMRMFVRFTEMPTISNYAITSAYLQLRLVDGTNTVTDIQAYRVNTSWDYAVSGCSIIFHLKHLK